MNDLNALPRGRRERIARWTTLSAEGLWQAWREGFADDDDAILTAIWIGNRLVKEHAVTTRRRFYSIKDAAIVRYGMVGQFVREEIRVCYGCHGTGTNDWGEPCERCDATGIFGKRILYSHRFVVAGQSYSWHSYVKPKTLIDEPADNLEHYGGGFTEEELAALALPLTGLLKLLTYVAAALWKLPHYDGIFRSGSAGQISNTLEI